MSSSQPSSPASSFDPSSSIALSDNSTFSNMSSSLFVNLTELASGGFPATELIKYLIEAIGHDVVAFRRNTQISYRLVDRVRDICNEINALIKKVDEEDSWESYEKFSAAIDPLEELLFALTAISEDETGRYLASVDSVEEAISTTENWEANRQELRTVLMSLHTGETFRDLFPGSNPEEEEEEVVEAGKHDDTTLFAEIQENIIGHTLVETARGSVPSLIRDIHSRLSNLQTMLEGSVGDGIVVMTIKAAMLVHGVMEISENPEADEEWMYHLKSEPVWQAADALLMHLYDVHEDDSASVTAIYEEYEGFLRVLRNIPGVELPESYTQLMKYAGKIRRPYFAQALALVSLCRLLARQFEETANRIAKNVYPLEDAFDETITALKAGIAAVSEIRTFDDNALETNDARVAFDAAKERIKECFAHFGLESMWADNEAQLTAALEKDRTRMNQVNEKFATRPPRNASDSSGLIQVNIKVCEQSPTGRLVLETSLGVEPITRLRAVRWSAAKALETDDFARALRQSEFQRMGANQAFAACRLNDAIGDISQGQTCDLTLVLT
ncbi:hypothetical protein BV25DRAFT_1911714 [Artomyces pyxidatus]|uniref:Uncharacterized protein n=1 Tax=Artomyces pyxidatus TaxID=48021 RepID=A0ACB8THC4_9AGAM|nr:hypothetical protein BV25DRAFT_1911714 [Artomyces pyxidatus]